MAESKLGAKIYGFDVGATDLASEVEAIDLDSEVNAKFYGSEVPAMLVLPRMSYCAWPGTSKQIYGVEIYYLGTMSSGADTKNPKISLYHI